MFGRIIKGIIDKYFDENKHIQTLIVPGNHDNLVGNPDRNREEIIGFYKEQLCIGSFNTSYRLFTECFLCK